MDQILLYIVLVGAFAGFGLAIYNLLLPVLQRYGIELPPIIPSIPSLTSLSSRAGPDDDGWEDEEEFADPDTRRFAASTFSARKPLLSFRRRELDLEAEDEDDQDEEEELLGSLYPDIQPRASASLDSDGEDLPIDPELADLLTSVAEEVVAARVEDEDEDDEEADDEEDEDEYEDDAEEAVPEQPVVQVVSGGGTDDFLALFGEGAEEAKVVQAWRADLPDTGIDELLTEAREIREMLKGKKRPAA